ncbi:MAG: tripartite tricarboxylate transporter substrate binding protein [Xanthobacteraceae bacterium]|nr:tripartite tricarboxylate transporter substrate binding protein [Xanthobacteraceae bacterium]
MRVFRYLAAAVPGLIALCLLALRPAVGADNYPDRPVHFIVGFTAGGPTDIVARIVGEWLSDHLGQQFVVENRAGSGGMIAANAVVSAPPDGYTILFVAPNNAIGASLYKNLPFNFLRDTVPVAGIMRLANIMVVPPSLPVHSVAEFIAYAKAHPGELSFASSGNGTSVHMSGELFKAMTGINIVHVPYRGSSAAFPDLMTGKVHVMFDNLPGSIEFVRSGQLRALGVTTAKRSDALPDVPAIGEIVPGYEASVWYGIAAPKGTPPEAIETLNKAMAVALADPKMKARLAELGGIPMPMSPDEFGKLVADETEKWAKVVKFAGISVE